MKTDTEFVACTLSQAKRLGEDYFLLTLHPPGPYAFEPGQYVRMRFSDKEGAIERFYSIANAPTPENFVQFCILLNEPRVKDILVALTLKDRLEIGPAMGNFRIKDPKKPIVLVAGGSGISPMRAFFQSLTQHFSAPPRAPLSLIYGCRQVEAIPGKEEFIEMAKKSWPNLKIWMCAETGDFSSDDVLAGGIIDHLPGAIMPQAHYYICGSPRMLEAVKGRLVSLGIDLGEIFVDPY